MSNTFWDIGQKFQVPGAPDKEVIILKEILPGAVGTVPNLYVFGLPGNAPQVPWKVYEDDFAQLVVEGIWEPIGCDIDSLLARDSGQCQHVWQPYYGLAERYEYCTKCDKKRDC